MEEVICPRVKDFAFATDNGFKTHEIVEMEAILCKVSSILYIDCYPTY